MSALPNGWTQEPLAKLGTWTGGGTPSTTNPEFWTNGTIPWVSPKDMKQRRITTAQDSITEAAVRASTTNLIPENSVMLVTRSGILRHSLPVATNTQPVTLNQDMKALTPLEALLPDYLYFAIRRYERDILHGCCKGGTTVQSIEAPRLMAFAIPVPPLAEQRRIVGKIEALFSELDEGVANLKQARSQLAVYRQALLKHAFEGHLTAAWRTKHAPELESADQLLARVRAEMPENSKNSAPDVSSSACGWLELSLSDITKESLIGLVRASDLQNQEGRGFCYIKMDRVDMSGHVDIEPKVFVDCSREEVERFALRQGDILFNTRNSVELVGKTGLVRKPPPGPTVFNNNLMRIRLVSPVLPSFLNYQMCAPNFRNAMEQVKKATTSVAAVYGKDLWPLRLAIPSTREQQQIVDELDHQLDAVEIIEADIDLNLQKAEALRQSILKKAFAGELVPQDPADEPAAALLARLRAEREAAAAKSAKKKPATPRGAKA